MRYHKKQVLFLFAFAPELVQSLNDGYDPSVAVEHISRLGNVDVCELSLGALHEVGNYDVTIVVAHNDADRGLILADGTAITCQSFVEAIPESYTGTLDIAACNTADLAHLIKARCPNCHVMAASNVTGLELRLFIYPQLLEYIKGKDEFDYYRSFLTAVNEIKRQQTDSTGNLLPTNKLGSQKQAKTYSPKSIELRKPFLFILYIFNPEHKNKAQNEAKNFFEKGNLFSTTIESLNVKVGDRVKVLLEVIPHANVYFDDNPRKVTVEEVLTAVQFLITVNDCQTDTLHLKVKVYKNNNYKERIVPIKILRSATDHHSTTEIKSSKSLDESEKAIMQRVLGYLQKAPWKSVEYKESALALIESVLSDDRQEVSEILWNKLKNGRIVNNQSPKQNGVRVSLHRTEEEEQTIRVINPTQYLVGYFAKKGWLQEFGAAKIHRLIFGDLKLKAGPHYMNIIKGKEEKMRPKWFSRVSLLLDKELQNHRGLFT